MRIGVVVLLVLSALPAGGSSAAALTSEPSPRERVAKVACYAPAPAGYGVRRVSRCAHAGVGYGEEVRCPASAFARMRKPNLRVEIRGFTTESRHRKHGFVSLTAVGSSQTRVVVEAAGDVAWMTAAYCGEPSSGRPIKLAEFYSFRSTTLVRRSFRSLTTTPHAVYFDTGGAHGGVPIGCADLKAQ